MTTRRDNFKDKNTHLLFMILLILLSIWSAINPIDRLLWFGNFFVAFVYGMGFILTYKKFRFTTFSYTLLFIHLVIIIIAAKYNYENMPLFNTIQDWFGQSRNHYDRVGHFLQGFVPILLARELMLRNNYMQKSKFFILVLILMVLGISATWELLEFIGVFLFDRSAEYIISSQGDVWDAQWDMTLCFIGAISGLLTLSKVQDKKIEEHEKNT